MAKRRRVSLGTLALCGIGAVVAALVVAARSAKKHLVGRKRVLEIHYERCLDKASVCPKIDQDCYVAAVDPADIVVVGGLERPAAHPSRRTWWNVVLLEPTRAKAIEIRGGPARG